MGGESGAGREQGTVEEGVVSKMLVAYKPCGCRAWAVLDMNAHPGVTAQSYAEAVVEGLDVREEEHDRICALFCPQHVGAMTKGEK